MSNIQKQFKEVTKHVFLTKEEKDCMRERLVLYMEYKPMRTLQVHSAKDGFVLRNIPILSYFKAHHLSGALIIALAVTSSTFGVSFAAEDALPGDLLYGVKVNVNEEIKTALISEDDVESRIAWEQERAERRLMEAGQLVAEGRLDDGKQEQVSKLFAEHAENIVEQMRVAEEIDPALAAEASGILEEALDTHESVLSRISVEKTNEPDGGVRTLVSQVHSVAKEAEKIREEVEKKIDITEGKDEANFDFGENGAGSSTEGGSASEADSINMRERLTHRAKERSIKLQESAQTLYLALDPSSDMALRVQAQIALGEGLMQEGADALEKNDLKSAYGKYRKASAIFQNVKQALEVAQLFSIEIYPNKDAEDEGIESENVVSAEELDENELKMKAENEHTNTNALIDNARALLLTVKDLDISRVDTANKQIKDASALLLQGEIVFVLGSYDEAIELYKKSFFIAQKVIDDLEKDVERGNIQKIEVPVKENRIPDDVVESEEISIQHQYKDGRHVFKGTIVVPNPCTEAKGDIVVAESFPEQMTLALNTHEEEGVVCAQVLTQKEFFLEASASEQALFNGVRVNGVDKKWILTNFEMGLDESSTSSESIE